jgi:hypothetical protein
MCHGKNERKRKDLLQNYNPIANPKPSLDLFAPFIERTKDRVEGGPASIGGSW